MYYGEIKYNDIANGEGIRTSLFVSGCRVGCKECFNKVTWDFEYGQPFTHTTQDQIVDSLKPNHINGLTVLGGEPMEPENQKALLPLFKQIKAIYPNKTIWLYTGYLLDKDLIKGGKKYTRDTTPLLSFVDTVIDGPFIPEQHDIRLQFRGSRNQRIISLSTQ